MAIFIIEVIGCCALWFAVGYAFGLRETKRRLKAHQEVTDRLMNAGLSAPTANHLAEHVDMVNAAGFANAIHPTYGGISRSASPFAVATQQGQANQLFGGASMQNPVTYGATPSKFASLLSSAGRPPTAAQRDGVKRKTYDDIKKAME